MKKTYLATIAEQHLLEEISACQAHPGDFDFTIGYLKEAVQLIRESVKFRVPLNGSLLPGLKNDRGTVRDFIDKYIPEFRLPFDRTLIEYEFRDQGQTYNDEGIEEWMAPEGYSGVILLCSQKVNYAISVIPLWRVATDRGERWAMSNFMGVVNKISGRYHALPITEIGRLHGADSPLGLNDIRGEMGRVSEFMAALNCANTAPEDDRRGLKERNNVKRAKKGLPPYYSYKVLTISQGNSGSSSPRKGLGRSPRAHLRRGHIRRLPGKNVWVNAALVGNSSKGFVGKDYSVREMEGPVNG